MAATSANLADVIAFTDSTCSQKQCLLGVVLAVREGGKELDVETRVACTERDGVLSALSTCSLHHSPPPVTSLTTITTTAEDTEQQRKTKSPSVVLPEGVEELLTRKDTLRTDMESSQVRVTEIQTHLKTLSAARAASVALEQEEQEAQKEKETATAALFTARVGVKAITAADWTDLRAQQHPSPALVVLIETCLSLLGETKAKGFEGFLQMKDFGPRVVALKITKVPRRLMANAEAFLKTWPLSKVSREHATATSLHTWVEAAVRYYAVNIKKKSKAVTRENTTATTTTTTSASPVPEPATATAAEAAEEIHQLQRELREHLEYIDLVNAELTDTDEQIAERQHQFEEEQQLNSAARARAAAGEVALKQIAASQVLCVLDPATTACVQVMEAAQRTIAGATVYLSPICSRVVLEKLAKPGKNRQGRTRSASKTVRVTLVPTLVGEDDGADHTSRSVSPHIVIPGRSSGDRDHDSSSSSTKRHRSKNSEQQDTPITSSVSVNTSMPASMEVQLLRDELAALKADMRRVTEERDKLMVGRRERSRFGGGGFLSAGPTRFSTVQGGGGGSKAKDGQESPFDATIRPVVDRTIADELEDQLGAAHEQIKVLEARERDATTRMKALQLQLQQLKTAGSPAAGTIRSRRGSMTLPQDVGGDSLGATASAAHTPCSDTPHVADLPTSPFSANIQQQRQQSRCDELEARVRTLQQELDVQRKLTSATEERLNERLHASETDKKKLTAQQTELEALWRRFEESEARLAEEVETNRRQLFTATSAAAPATNAINTSTGGGGAVEATLINDPSCSNVFFGNVHHGTSAMSIASASPSVSAAQQNRKNPIHGAVGATDFDHTAAYAYLPVTRAAIEQDILSHAASSGGGPLARQTAMVNFGNNTTIHNSNTNMSPTFHAGSGRSGIDARSVSVVASPYAAQVSQQPVEQMAPAELRHEVRSLRMEVERCQSAELRLMTELAATQDRQREDRKRRQQARTARLQMLNKLQDAVQEVVAKQTDELQRLPELLEKSREATDSVAAKRRMSR